LYSSICRIAERLALSQNQVEPYYTLRPFTPLALETLEVEPIFCSTSAPYRGSCRGDQQFRAGNSSRAAEPSRWKGEHGDDRLFFVSVHPTHPKETRNPHKPMPYGRVALLPFLDPLESTPWERKKEK
jgi:hypothetical protein